MIWIAPQVQLLLSDLKPQDSIKPKEKEGPGRAWQIRISVIRCILKQIEIAVGARKRRRWMIKRSVFLPKALMCFRYYILVL